MALQNLGSADNRSYTADVSSVLDLVSLAEQLKLPTRERRFCEALVTDPEQHAGRAALVAGVPYTSRRVTACRWLKKNRVQTYLNALRSAAGATPVAVAVSPVTPRDIAQVEARAAVASAQEVLERLTAQARLDPTRYYRTTPAGAVELDLERVRAEGAGNCVSEVGHEPESGAPRLRWHDSQKALDKLSRYYGLYKDETTSNKTININTINILAQLSPAAKEELARALLGQVVDAEVVSDRGPV